MREGKACGNGVGAAGSDGMGGKRLGRIGASEGKDSARRNATESIVGWLRWMADVSVLKPQLMEIQAVEREGRMMG